MHWNPYECYLKAKLIRESKRCYYVQTLEINGLFTLAEILLEAVQSGVAWVVGYPAESWIKKCFYIWIQIGQW